MMLLRLVAMVTLLLPGIGTCAGADALPQEALAEQLNALHLIKALQADFSCQKQIAALQQPLVSSGTITIAGSDQLRFSTLRPYVSEIILDRGMVLTKSQHEAKWTRTNNASRPGLPAIMQQVAGWSLGDTTQLNETYKVSRGAAALPQPPADNTTTKPAAANGGAPLVFVLTPLNPEIAKAIKSLTLGIDPTTHYLIFLQLTTAEQDVTRYWFYNIRINATLPPDTFSPSGPDHE